MSNVVIGKKDGDHKRDYGFWLVLVGAGSLGVALAACARALPASPKLVQDLEAALGDALIIAVVLAITVDRWVQSRFARDVGKDVFFAVLRRAAPDWYVNDLVDKLGRGLLAESCNWTFALVDAGQSNEFCVVDFRAAYKGRNIESSTVRWPGEISLLNSSEGPPSSFTLFSLHQSQAPDGPWEPILALRGPKIAALQERDAHGRAKLSVDAYVSPGAHFQSDLRARVTLRSTDIFPLVARFPTKDVTVAIDSAEHPKVECRLQYQLTELQRVSSNGAKSYYQLPHPLQAGATVMLRLSKRATAASASAAYTARPESDALPIREGAG